MIDLDDISTYPVRLLDYIEQYGEHIIEETDRYNKAAETIEGRINPPPRDKYKKALTYAVENCKNTTIKGYHCAKVLDINVVRVNGLHVLDAKSHIEQFLELCKNHPLLKPHLSLYKKKLTDWLSHEQIPYRNRKLWFCLNYELVKSTGCIPFFRYFGGEMVRWPILDDEALLEPLEKIGIPIIIVGELRILDLGIHKEHGVSEQMLARALHEKISKSYRYDNIEDFIETDLTPGHILEIREYYGDVIDQAK